MPCVALFDYDPIAVWGLVVAIIGVVVGIIAAVAAILAAKYAKHGPTSDDLARVEQNTSHLEEVRSGITSLVKRQKDADALAARARLVDIMVSGEGEVGKDLSVLLASAASGVSLTRLELLTELGTSFGTVTCRSQVPLQFVATISSFQLGSWKGGGTTINMYATRLVLRVWMTFDDQTGEASKDMPVTLSRVADRSVAGGTIYHGKPMYTIRGAV